MSISLRLAALAAILTTTLVMTARATAQQNRTTQPRAGTSQPSGGDRIAVIDVNHIFKNHVGFKTMVEDWKKDVKAAEEEVKRENERIEKRVNDLRRYKPGSDDFKSREETLAKERAAIQVNIQIKKKDLMLREAKMYLKVYKETKQAVAYFAQQAGITLVLRFNSGDVNTEDPRQIQALMLRPVLYQNRVDITGDILARLNPPADRIGKPQPRINEKQPRRR